MQPSNTTPRAEPAHVKMILPCFLDMVEASRSGTPILVQIDGQAWSAKVTMSVREHQLPEPGRTDISFELSQLTRAVEA